MRSPRGCRKERGKIWSLNLSGQENEDAAASEAGEGGGRSQEPWKPMKGGFLRGGRDPLCKSDREIE